jgi:thiol-disulfide isomerase/thioredoxin
MKRSTSTRTSRCGTSIVIVVLVAGLLLLMGLSVSNAFTVSQHFGISARKITTTPNPTPTRLFYSSTVENPLEEGQVQQLAEETAAKRPRLPNLHTALTARDFERLVPGECNAEYCVVRYYAPWCRACKKAEPLFIKLAQDHPDIKFVQVPIVSTNSQLVEKLGVTVIPWGQIYRPNLGLVSEAKINSKNFAEFRSAVASLLSP